MNSFIGWIGGKKLLRKIILEHFPKDSDKRTYVEVFGGAGWVLFGKEVNRGQIEVFNDFDSNLVNLYRCIKYHREELQKEFDFVLSAREQFDDYREQVNIRGLTDIQRAARYYYLIKMSFGCKKSSYATSPRSFSGMQDVLLAIQKRLERVVIERQDFEKLIKIYDRDMALFYLDPPYYGTEHYYEANFSKEDHERLKDCLLKIKGKFILSYNDCDFIRNLYQEYDITEVSRSNNLSKEKNRYKEILITNYKS